MGGGIPITSVENIKQKFEYITTVNASMLLYHKWRSSFRSQAYSDKTTRCCQSGCIRLREMHRHFESSRKQAILTGNVVEQQFHDPIVWQLNSLKHHVDANLLNTYYLEYHRLLAYGRNNDIDVYQHALSVAACACCVVCACVSCICALVQACFMRRGGGDSSIKFQIPLKN